MTHSSRASALVVSMLTLFGTAARAADTSTDVGLFTAIITGVHRSSGQADESGVVPGAAFEITQHLDRFRIHLEAIPTVAAATSGVGRFGRTSASLDLVNATALVDVDARRRFRVGAGFQLVNLTNTDGGDGSRNAVRVTSPVVTFGTTLPLRGTQFVEANVLVDPNVRGNLLFFDRTGAYVGVDPEVGAEIDYGASYGWRRGNVTYLVGGRALSYHTRDATTGALVDRNVGGGATFEVRFALGRDRDAP